MFIIFTTEMTSSAEVLVFDEIKYNFEEELLELQSIPRGDSFVETLSILRQGAVGVGDNEKDCLCLQLIELCSKLRFESLAALEEAHDNIRIHSLHLFETLSNNDDASWKIKALQGIADNAYFRFGVFMISKWLTYFLFFFFCEFEGKKKKKKTISDSPTTIN